MTEQEFAFRLLTFFIPYPLSRMLPRLLRRLFRGPSAEIPGNWAAAAFDSILKLYDDTAAAAESLLASAEKMTPTDQLTDLIASLRSDLDTALNLIDLLRDIIDDLDDFTPDQVRDSFEDVIPALDDLTDSTDDLAGYLPPVVIPAPPPYTPPVPPIYIGPPVPGPTGPTSPQRRIPSLKAVWFKDEFTEIDPAIWTDWSQGTGVNSIVDNQLKMLSAGAGDYAYLATADDNTIPETFRFTFNLTVLSGTGEFVIVARTGVHHIFVIFDPPNILKFRQKSPAGYKSIDVGNYMNEKKWWRFFYNGTLCDIYSGNSLIDSELTVYESASSKGQISLSCDNVLALYLDNVKIVYPV